MKDRLRFVLRFLIVVNLNLSASHTSYFGITAGTFRASLDEDKILILRRSFPERNASYVGYVLPAGKDFLPFHHTL
jgi:hypothetical protein